VYGGAFSEAMETMMLPRIGPEDGAIDKMRCSSYVKINP
jgi:hypothetical protein